MQTTPHEPCFIDYWDEIDAAMLRLFGIDTGDAGIEVDMIAGAEADGQTAEEFALWFGEKYGLTLKSEWG